MSEKDDSLGRKGDITPWKIGALIGGLLGFLGGRSLMSPFLVALGGAIVGIIYSLLTPVKKNNQAKADIFKSLIKGIRNGFLAAVLLDVLYVFLLMSTPCNSPDCGWAGLGLVIIPFFVIPLVGLVSVLFYYFRDRSALATIGMFLAPVSFLVLTYVGKTFFSFKIYDSFTYYGALLSMLVVSIIGYGVDRKRDGQITKRNLYFIAVYLAVLMILVGSARYYSTYQSRMHELNFATGEVIFYGETYETPIWRGEPRHMKPSSNMWLVPVRNFTLITDQDIEGDDLEFYLNPDQGDAILFMKLYRRNGEPTEEYQLWSKSR